MVFWAAHQAKHSAFVSQLQLRDNKPLILQSQANFKVIQETWLEVHVIWFAILPCQVWKEACYLKDIEKVMLGAVGLLGSPGQSHLIDGLSMGPWDRPRLDREGSRGEPCPASLRKLALAS